ncbi:hypothetical protein M758_7G026900 [Ceratodon purpureus]|uniref:Uncharacterized protein n=1 Tax=Ceratodon purpureus TaxID=3225 RepID=A0A8T0H264_CERPU|nr:hypothetical protein KC19_7G028400 [Ceratodon purpureus]KAG0609952.1 hypothetical protein M758_7G026900 [Ceratodon purpureus]
MRKRRHYVKTSKCYHRLPTIEEAEELGAGLALRATTQPRSYDNMMMKSPEVDLEDCSTWGLESLKAKLARLKELKQTLEPQAKQMEEKISSSIKQSYEEVMDFVNAKSKQVRAVQIVWPNLQFRNAIDSD